MTPRFGEPVVEVHARPLEVGLDPVHDAPRRERANLLGVFFGQVGEPVAVLVQDLARELDDVLALIVVVAHLDLATERLLIAHPDAVRQVLHLGAGVVVVVLALDLPAGPGKDAGDAVAQRGVARRCRRGPARSGWR